MHGKSFYILSIIAAATSSPLHQSSVTPRGLSSIIDNAADAVTNVVNEARQAVESATSAASDAVASGTSIFGTLEALPSIANEVMLSGSIANTALWQEALAFDAKAKAGSMNQMAYRAFAYLQKIESDPHSTEGGSGLRPYMVAKSLQAMQVYPTQFNQAQAADPAKSLVELSPEPQQTIQSFGASGAWWPNFLKDFPPAQQKNLSSLLFSEDWLHLSGYRYNLGASGDNDTQPVSTPGRGVESFMLSDGSYNWNRDGHGYYYLKAAQDFNVSSITAFVNAIPSALTSEKKPCGTSLLTTQIADFVSYITKVLSHFSENNIKIDYISPMNEPDNSFSTCNQEGMAVLRSIRANVFTALRSELQKSPNPGVKNIKILGDETSQIASQALLEYPAWLPSSLASKTIDAIAVHMYDYPSDSTLLNYRRTLIDMAAPSPPPPVKMTEISTFTTASGIYAAWGKTGPKVMGPEFDPGINSALDMARMIWQWLVLVNAESWEWWTAVSNMLPCSPSTTPGCARTYSASDGSVGKAGYNDGLLYIDPEYASTKDYTFYLTKRFWVFRHFTRFLRPGATRFDVPNEILPYGSVAVAGRNVDGVYSTIFINRNATEQVITMKLPGDGGKIVAAAQTTDSVDFSDVDLPVVGEDGTFGLTLPARGVLSVQFTVEGGGRGHGGGVATAKHGRAVFERKREGDGDGRDGGRRGL